MTSRRPKATASRAVKRDQASKRRHNDRSTTCLASGCPRPGLTLELPVCEKHWKLIGPDVKPIIDRECLPGKKMSAEIRKRLVEALQNK